MSDSIPLTPREHEFWRRGERHAREHLAVETMEQFSGSKLTFLKYLAQAARNQDTPEWAAYAEGIRTCLNILKTIGAPEDAYVNIINRSMPAIEVKIPDYDKSR